MSDSFILNLHKLQFNGYNVDEFIKLIKVLVSTIDEYKKEKTFLGMSTKYSKHGETISYLGYNLKDNTASFKIFQKKCLEKGLDIVSSANLDNVDFTNNLGTGKKR